MRIPLFLLALAVSAGPVPAILLPLAAQGEAELDPYEWIIETYPFPSEELVRGFATEERGALTAPQIPAGDATDEVKIDFLRKSNSIAAHYLKKQGLALPEGTVVVFDPVSLTLAARAPRLTQSSIAATRGLANHIGAWETLAGAPEVTHLSSSWIEGRSGQRCKVKVGRDFYFPVANHLVTEPARGEKAAVDAKPVGTLFGEFETEEIGSSLEFDPVLGADDYTIEVNYGITHDYAEPTTVAAPPVPAEGGVGLDGPTTHLHRTALTSQTILRDGMMRLVGSWRPEGDPRFDQQEVIQAVFMKVDVIPVQEEAAEVAGE